MTSTRSPGWMASRWISSLSVPYSSWYSSRTTAHGSLPALRTGTNPAPMRYATGAAMMKPRASMPSTRSTATSWKRSTSSLTDRWKPSGVAEQRRDVAERDARLRVVGDVADQIA